MAILSKSQISTITELVNQNSSRYSLKRPMNSIIEYNSEKVYEFPWQCEINKSDGDVYLYITSSMRLDQLANEYYGDPKLWWVIAQANNLKNPLIEFKIGTMIRIPSLSTLIQNGVTR